MPLVPNFSASQAVGLPAIITLTDSSTGTDGTITTRRVYFVPAYGDNLVVSGTTTTYETWDYAASSKSFNVLTKDFALNITVEWYAGAVLTYTKTLLFGFTLYNETFLYELTQNQSSDPDIIQDTNYYNNKGIMREEVDSGNQAIDLASDISGAQNCYDRATNMRLNESKYF